MNALKSFRDVMQYNRRYATDAARQANPAKIVIPLQIMMREAWDYYEGNPDNLLPVSEVARAMDFAAFLNTTVRDLLLAGYQEFREVWRDVAMADEDNVQGSYSEYPSLGTVSTPQQREAQGDFGSFIFVSDFTIINFKEYGGIMELDRTLLEDDRTGAIMRQPTLIGQAHNRRRNTEAIAAYNDNGAIYDASNWFANTHPNVTGGTALSANDNNGALGGLSEANLETALQGIGLWQGLQGEKIDVLQLDYDLLVARNQLETALRLKNSTAQVADNRSEGVANVVGGQIRRIISHPELTATTWYVLPVATHRGHIYQIRHQLEIEQEDPRAGLSFSHRRYRYRSYERTGRKVVDFRSAYKGN